MIRSNSERLELKIGFVQLAVDVEVVVVDGQDVDDLLPLEDLRLFGQSFHHLLEEADLAPEQRVVAENEIAHHQSNAD